MTSDADLQRSFAKFLRCRRDLGKDEEAKAFAREHIAGNERVSPVEQLETYREQYWWRHTGSLVEDFPAVGGILGQSDWERLVEEYLVSHPPTGFSLRELGEHLPDFASTREWLSNRELVVDMARLEWAHIEVFDAPDAPPLAPEKLESVAEDAWEEVELVTNPALRLLRVAYPVVELRRKLLVLQSSNDAGESPSGDFAASEPIALPGPETQHLAICRSKLTIEHHTLDPRGFALLSKLSASIPLGRACESTANELSMTTDALAAELETWFLTWTARGYFVDLRV